MEKIGHCGTCKHWIADDSQSDIPYYQKLASWLKRNGLGRCTAVLDVNPHSAEENPEQLAFTMDAERYCSNLFTRPSFGCVLHERAELAAPTLPPSPPKMRRLWLRERIKLFANSLNLTVPAAESMIRFMTNVGRNADMVAEMESPQHQYLDQMGIPREVPVDD